MLNPHLDDLPYIPPKNYQTSYLSCKAAYCFPKRYAVISHAYMVAIARPYVRGLMVL